MISSQETLNLSPFMAIYDLVVPKDNRLRQINELVDFSFILEELKTKYCLDNGRNAISPIIMFKYLLLKSIFDLSDVDIVERSKCIMVPVLFACVKLKSRSAKYKIYLIGQHFRSQKMVAR